MANLSNTDANQVLIHSYDETQKKLKTDSSISSSSGAITGTVIGDKTAIDVNVTAITLNHADDSVAVVEAKEAVKVDLGSDANYCYKGYAAIGASPSSAVWLICRISLSDANAGTTQWASALYNQVWNDRLSLTYT